MPITPKEMAKLLEQNGFVKYEKSFLFSNIS